VQYDSLTHTRNAVWELEFPSGEYDVRVVAGDPSFHDSHYHFLVEGGSILNGSPTDSQRWIEGRRTVNLTDGRLTISSGPDAENNKISFLEVRVPD